jgi:outer membrane protein assembly factor BamB
MGLATSGAGHLNGPDRSEDGESPDPAAPIASRRLGYGTDWCFDAGAPIAGPPALGPEGQIYVATHEGYVHALDENGAFRWSYTVKGAVIGGPRMLPHGSVVVATHLGLIYALTPEGRRQWVFKVPGPITTAVTVSAKGTLVFGASDRVLYTVSPYGGVVWRAPIKGGFSTPPEVVAPGLVAVGTSRGVVLVRGPNRQTLVEASGVRQIAAGPESVGFGWALADAGIVPFAGVDPVEFAGLQQLSSVRGGQLLAASGGELVWIAADGQAARRVALPAPLSGSVALDARGTVYAPTHEGRLLAARPSDSAFAEFALLGSSSLSDAVVDDARGRVVAAAGEGVVCAVSVADFKTKTGD